MLNGTTYKTPEFYCTKLNGKLFKFASESCAMSWSQRLVEHPAVPHPDSTLGFRAGTLLQDFRSGNLWYIDGAARKTVDYDAWQENGFKWSDIVICTRKELELHEAQGDL